MPTTSNFGWTTPADTDLVKDGAAAIRTLGNGIDTSLVDLKGGTTGQYLIKQSNTDLDFTWTTNTADIDGITATSPLTGGGTSGTITVGIQDATTAQKGAVQLTNSTSSTSTTTAATPNSVKSAYDLAAAAIPNSLADAKGDLIAATANDTPARLAVGNNGETLVADSSASVGLRYQSNFAAGKNAIINGDFRIAQRGTTFTVAANASTYTLDRWACNRNGSGTVTVTQETFTPGTAPVAGYEGVNYFRFNQSVAGTGATFSVIGTLLEDVRLFAGQTVTLSFWAKTAAAKTYGTTIRQYFGTGGSASVDTNGGNFTTSTSWQRFSFTITLPSIAGKTIGTGSYLHPWINVGLNDTTTLDLWGVQLEAGSVATAFQTATGTLAGELAACQRYFYRKYSDVTAGGFGNVQATSTTNVDCAIPHPVTMRATPTIARSGLTVTNATGTRQAVSALVAGAPTTSTADFSLTTGGLVAGNAATIRGNGTSTTDYLEASAEL